MKWPWTKKIFSDLPLAPPPMPHRLMTPDAEKLALLNELAGLDSPTIFRALLVLRRISEIDMTAALGQPIHPEHLHLAHSQAMAGVFAMDGAIGLLENLAEEIRLLKPETKNEDS